MSQSPIDDFSVEVMTRYRQGWSALSRLLHMDRSFSGRERHTAFLNQGDGSFADVSAASGFDLLDDGRTVIGSDWDFDGDLDLWVTARTAPRIRLLRNDLATADKSISLRLRGDGVKTNRDAVGARCEIWVKGDDRPIIRGVRAGDSFLSQSSAWLHFGLGDAAEIDRVSVRWPGGVVEQFTGVAPGGRFELKQGTSKAAALIPPARRKPLVAAEPEIAPEPEAARIILPGRLPVPPVTTADGKEIPFSKLQGPLLINFWASWCAPCLIEMREWTEHASELRSSGLNILSLNTDDLGEAGDSEQARARLVKMGFPFETAAAAAQTVEVFDLFQRSFLDRWLPLPVPSSFLVDREGRVAVIYKGPVTAKTLIEDLALLEATPEALRDAATPFGGLWGSPLSQGSPVQFTSQLVAHAQLELAEAYLQRYLQVERADAKASPSTMGSVAEVIGNLASGRGDHAAAVAAFTGALELRPGDAKLQKLLQLAKQKSSADTLKKLRKAVELNPTDGAAHHRLADALRASGDFKGAIEGYKNTLRHAPKMLIAAGKLSWTLAVHPDAEIRKPAEALHLAGNLNKITGGKDPDHLDLLGVAQAATGDFDAATASARAALQLFETGTPMHRTVAARLALYEANKPYIEEGWRK